MILHTLMKLVRTVVTKVQGRKRRDKYGKNWIVGPKLQPDTTKNVNV